jgi:hypothetical protein
MGRIDHREHRAAWNEGFLLVGRILRRMAVVFR